MHGRLELAWESTWSGCASLWDVLLPVNGGRTTPEKLASRSDEVFLQSTERGAGHYLPRPHGAMLLRLVSAHR